MRSLLAVAAALAAAALLLQLPTSARATTTTFNADAGTTILKNGSPVTARGFVLTGGEYLLRGIGMECFAKYSWATPGSLLSLDTAFVDNILNNMLPAPAGVQPTLRIGLTAAYWLDQPTSAWSGNRDRYPNLAAQYRALITSLVNYVTSKGVVAIMDLHWNDDVTEQQPMALATNSLAFWSAMGSAFGSNPFVWYELYNEPHVESYAAFKDGDATYAGMIPMYSTLRNLNVRGLVLIAGQADYAYDSASLVRLQADVPSLQGVVWVAHPYMGPYQAGDPIKTATGFDTLASAVLATGRPLFLTELGQYCCAANGACYAYPGSFNGVAMGYVEAVFTIAKTRGVSWTIWAWRGAGGNCNGPDANDGTGLYSAAAHSGQGADYVTLFPKYYAGALAPTSPTSPTTRQPTAAQTTPSPTTRQPTAAQTTRSPTSKQPTASQTTKSPTSKQPTASQTTRSPTKLPTSAGTGATKSPTKQPTTSNGGACVATWGQCGGQGWTGSTTCCTPSANACVVSNQWYSQCLPIPTSSPTPGSTPCAAVYGQCGGQGWTGLTCCESGSTCTVGNPWYSQCLPTTTTTTTTGASALAASQKAPSAASSIVMSSFGQAVGVAMVVLVAVVGA